MSKRNDYARLAALIVKEFPELEILIAESWDTIHVRNSNASAERRGKYIKSDLPYAAFRTAFVCRKTFRDVMAKLEDASMPAALGGPDL